MTTTYLNTNNAESYIQTSNDKYDDYIEPEFIGKTIPFVFLTTTVVNILLPISLLIYTIIEV